MGAIGCRRNGTRKTGSCSLLVRGQGDLAGFGVYDFAAAYACEDFVWLGCLDWVFPHSRRLVAAVEAAGSFGKDLLDVKLGVS